MSDISTKIVELLSGAFVIPGATNVGVLIKTEENTNSVYLIDSGTTEIDAEYILGILNS